MSGALVGYTPSRTEGSVMPLYSSPKYVGASDRVLVIDLASDQTIPALAELIGRSSAVLLGVGCAPKKTFEPGWETLSGLGVTAASLAAVTELSGAGVQAENGR